MKKNILYIAGGAIILAVLFALYLINSNQSKSTISIQTTQGNLSVSNPKMTPEAKQLSPQDTLAESTSDYDIVYFDFDTKDRSFLIDIKGADIMSSRTKAEAAFLQLTNLDQNQVCLLNVSLRVSSVDYANLAGEEFGLSFCPNGKAFPK